MKDFDVEDVKRIVLRRPNGQRYYVTINGRSIMVHSPNESAFENADLYHGMNAVCRLASRARKGSMTMGQIAYQIQAAGVGHKTAFSELARIIREYVQLEDYLNE